MKRAIPSGDNKIHAVAVGRLYVAYPDRSSWTYTGLSGAIALVDDLVGHTFWLKMVDISSAQRRVIWDQELYEDFNYTQDRVFFHSFELEDCYAGFSFVDEKEAKRFIQKMEKRDKSASRETRNNVFLAPGQIPINGTSHQQHKHRGISSLLGLGSTKSYSSPQVSPAIQPSEPSRSPMPRKKGFSLDEVDPSWKPILKDLLSQGFTEDDLEKQADFIRDYIETELANKKELAARADQPPPPPGPRAEAPVPPPAGRLAQSSAPSISSRPPDPPRSRFHVPPPIVDAGKRLHEVDEPQRSPRRTTISSQEPPLPQRPPKIPHEEVTNHRRMTPPSPMTIPSLVTAPARGQAPKPPPPRRQTQAPSNAHTLHAVPPAAAAPPPLPPKELLPGPPPAPQRNVSAPVHSTPVTQSLPLRRPVPGTPSALSQPSAAPPLPPPAPAPVPVIMAPPPAPPLPAMTSPPPAPPLPSPSAPPPAPALPTKGPSSAPPPTPALPTKGPPSAVPPPPPPPPPPAPTLPGRDGPAGIPPAPPPPSAPALPAAFAYAPDRNNVMASIRQAGGIGGLRKVDPSKRRDRSAAAVPGTADQSAAPTAASEGASADSGMASALAKALAARKKKVAASGKCILTLLFDCCIVLLRISQMMRMMVMIGSVRKW